MAVTTGIEDVGNYYAADEVEGALQEIGAGAGAGRTNGMISGGTWTRSGNVLTIDAGSYASIGAALVDISGMQITLADGVRWVYVDPTTGVLASNASAPDLDTEPVLISKVTTTASVIDLVASVDARFFVAQIDRKPPLTLRNSDGATDANAEGCFMTLRAALLYLETYSTAGASQAETQTLVVRGNVTVTGPTTIPTAGIRFVGDGSDAAFVTGATLAPMFDLAGNSNVEFHKLTFRCEHTGSTAIYGGATSCRGLQVTDCQFIGGAQEWVTAISITFAGSYNSAVVKNTVVDAATSGIVIERPDHVLIEGVTVTEQGSSGASGIILNASGPFAGEGSSHIVNCNVTGFSTAVTTAGDGSTVRGCTIKDCDTGVGLLGGETSVSECNITVSATTGVMGISAGGSISVTSTRLHCTRSSWSGETPRGIDIVNGGSRVFISNCGLSGFRNAAIQEGDGIRFSKPSSAGVVQGCDILDCAAGVQIEAGTSNIVVKGSNFSSCGDAVAIFGVDTNTNRTRDISVEGNTVTFPVLRGIRSVGHVRELSIVGNVIDGLITGLEATPSALGISIEAADVSVPWHVALHDNVVWRCAEGISVRGDSIPSQCQLISIRGNHIHHCGYPEDISGWTYTYAGRGSKGIGLEFCDQVSVTGNTIEKIGIVLDNLGVEAWPNGGGQVIDVQARGIYSRNCDRLEIQNNIVQNVVANDVHGSGYVLPYGIYCEVESVGTGADHTVSSHRVSGNTVTWEAGLPGIAGGGEYGITLRCQQGSDTFVNTVSNIQINGNLVHRTRRDGIRLETGRGAVLTVGQVNGNTVNLNCQQALVGGTDQAAIYLAALAEGTGAATLTHFQVCGNSIYDSGFTAGTHGVGVEAYFFVQGILRELQFNGNLIEKCNVHGLRVIMGTTVTAGASSLGTWTVNNNLVKNAGGSAVRMEAIGTGAGSLNVDNVCIKGNSSETTTGLCVDVTINGTLTMASIQGNTSSGGSNYGVGVTLGPGTPGLSENLFISGNNNSGGVGGVYFNSAGAARAVEVSGNMSLDHTSKGLWVILSGASSAVAVDGNTLRSSGNNVVGIDFDLPNAAVSCISVCNNKVRMTGTGTASMNVAGAGGSAVQDTMSFQGNVFNGAVTGVTRGANFAPDRSICANNVERTAGPAAGLWGNGGGGTFSDIAAFTNSVTANNQD